MLPNEAGQFATKNSHPGPKGLIAPVFTELERGRFALDD